MPIKQPVHHSLIDTPAFKTWFGKSKVVDKRGRPLLVFHGTQAGDFDVFNTDPKPNSHEFGAHFGTHRSAEERVDGLASAYRAGHQNGTNIGSYYLKIEHPLEMEDLGDWDPEKLTAQLEHIGFILEPYRKYTTIELIQIMKDAGYDGISYENEHEHAGSISWAVFSPNQIKSAIGNNGEFNPENNNMLKEYVEVKSKLTPAQEAMIQTPAFKSWFNGSKVVDEEGKPLVVYHGTKGDFDVFKTDVHASWGVGAHFGSLQSSHDIHHDLMNPEGDPDKQSIGAFFLKIKNPLEVPDMMHWEAANMASFMKYKIGVDVPKEQFMGERFWTSQNVRDALINAGYDGLTYVNKYEDVGSISWTVFNPNQIKSAMGNNGEFSDKDPSVIKENALLTSTPAFQSWFNGSKIVDIDGNPRVMYHGTHGDFEKFDLKAKRINRNGNFEGFYFRSNPEYLGVKAGNIMPVYLSIKRPYYKGKSPLLPKTIEKAKNLLMGRYNEDYVEGKMSRLIHDKMFPDIFTSEDQRELVIDSGYDGMIDGSIEHGEVCAFYPEQIKSATGNNGEFNPKNDSIVNEMTDTVTIPRRKIPVTTLQPKSFAAGLDALVNQLSHISNVRERIKWVESRFNRISQGSSRLVYRLPGGDYVLKLAFNDKGKQQNALESNQQVHQEYGDLLTPIYAKDESNKQPEWIVTAYASDINTQELSNFLGIKTQDLLLYLASGQTEVENFEELEQKVEKAIVKQPLLEQLIELVDTLQLWPEDIVKKDSWGRLKNGQIVLRDFGMTTTTYRQHSHNPDSDRKMANIIQEARAEQTAGLLAPNGQPTKLTPGLWRVVRTPQFKAWFGDWEGSPGSASKIVDDNGEPCRLYHGTQKDFGSFKNHDDLGNTIDRMLGTHLAYDPGVTEAFSIGAYAHSMDANMSQWSPDNTWYRGKGGEAQYDGIETVSNYDTGEVKPLVRKNGSYEPPKYPEQAGVLKPGGNTIPVFANVRNPLIIKNEKNRKDETAVACEVLEIILPHNVELFSRLFKSLFYNKTDDEMVEIHHRLSHGEPVEYVKDRSYSSFKELMDGHGVPFANDSRIPYMIQKGFKNSGYDGIIYNNTSTAEVRAARGMNPLCLIVPDSTQLKSSVGNKGTFDPTNPNIVHETKK